MDNEKKQLLKNLKGVVDDTSLAVGSRAQALKILGLIMLADRKAAANCN